MASIDLNIVQRGLTENLGWSANMGMITPDDLARVSESRTDNSGSLNSLPTPFARFFVFKEAFRRVLEQKQNPKDPKKEAGRAYEQLVSNTLDVFELLYNKKWHENQWSDGRRKLVIREWNYSENLPVLKDNVPILGNAVESYFRDDLGESSMKLFFVLLEDAGKDYLLGTSSPMTGFITPPDLDLIPVGNVPNQYTFVGDFYKTLESNPVKRRNGGYYFRDIVLFENRDRDFKNYLYNKLFADGASIDGRYSTLRNYVQAFAADKDIVKDWSDSELKPLYSEDNNELAVNGLKLYCSDGKNEVNYFQSVLVKMPYTINGDKFVTARSRREGEQSSCYMLPLTREGLLALKSDDFEFKYKETATGDVVDFDFIVPGKEYSQKYQKDSDTKRNRILDMSSSKKNFGLSVFPNVLSPIKEENNYFKVMLLTSDGNANKTFSVQNVSLEFFYKDENGKFQPITETQRGDNYEFGVKTPVVRSVQKDDVESGTKYYEVFNSRFDAVMVNWTDDGETVSFVIFPNWDEAKNSTKKAYTYAVDLGTSNTYISRREKGKYMEPQQLEMTNVISSSLYSYEHTAQRSLVNSIENAYPKEFSSQILTEFVPPLIDGKAYKFPIRTALCVKENTGKPELFDNSNIAFFYEKLKCPSNHTIKANIKWSKDEENLRVFIREILLLIKADILQENGSIADTEIIWFRPLSFDTNAKEKFPKLWKEEAAKILALRDSSSQIKCYTESEAPYYYFDTKNVFSNRNSVAVIDIGGGTADVVYYMDGKPAIANSVRFGCDVLWSEGFNKMTDSKENGIYTYYKDKVDISDDTLKIVYNSMIETSSQASSNDIINFWLNNRKYMRIVDKFGTDFKPVFAYHYVALMYYVMSMFKVNGLEYPKTLIFSGNGSRYIDDFLSGDVAVLKELTSKVIFSVYDTVSEKIELILPEYRKECTCYGGLYHKDEEDAPRPVVYVGNGKQTSFVTVEELKKAYPSLKPDIEGEVHKMNGVFGEVMKSLVQNGASEPFKIDEIKKIVDGVVSNALESNFQKVVVDGSSDSEPFNDSLFFYPVIQGIFELTKVCPKAKK